MHRILPILLALSACQRETELTVPDWSVPDPDPAPPDHGSWLSMDLAPDGQHLVIAYYDREKGGLGFAVGTPNADGTVTWEHEQVDGYADPNSGIDTGDRGKFASMKVAPDGTVWVAYYDATKKDLRYAHRLGGRKSWVTGLIDDGNAGTANAGEWASLALDANGSPVVAYHDADGASLRVARLAATQDDAVEGYEWESVEAWKGQPYSGTTVDADGVEVPVNRPANVGLFNRLMIDGGTEYIAYYDEAQQRLALLQGGASNWTQSFVSEEGINRGQWPSMLIDGGTLYIAFHDVQSQDLVVASRGTGGWSLDVADVGDYVGADTELIRRGGDVAVVYFDGQNNDMKLASKAGNKWTTETLGLPDHAVGFHNEIVRVADGFWAGSYDFTSRSVFMTKLQDP